VIGPERDVIAREIDVADVGAATARERPDVALVGLGESSEHALEPDVGQLIAVEQRLSAWHRPRLRASRACNGVGAVNCREG
jgi:hypothetical protein